MGRHRATRLATIAVGLSVLGLAPFAQFAHAETIPAADPDAVAGPVGVVLSDTDTGGNPPPVVEPPPPPPQPPTGEEPPPTQGTEPTRTPDSGGSAPSGSAPPAASAAVRLPRAERTAIASPSITRAGSIGVLAPAASNATRSAGAGVSLEDIFLRDTVGAAPQAIESAGRSALPIVGSSSLPAMLLKAMIALLGMLFLAARHLGTSLTGSNALGRTIHRRNAPRGWRIVVTTPLPAEPVVAPASPLERPVLAPLEPVSAGAR